MVAGILYKFGNDVETMTILPSGGGAYNVWKDDVLVFSKKQAGRFPFSDDEVIRLLS